MVVKSLGRPVVPFHQNGQSQCASECDRCLAGLLVLVKFVPEEGAHMRRVLPSISNSGDLQVLLVGCARRALWRMIATSASAFQGLFSITTRPPA